MHRFPFNYILILLATASGNLMAQKFQLPVKDEGYANFVPNPSFETTTREFCRWNQNGRDYMEAIAYWDSPTETTPDMLSMRAKTTCWSYPKKHSNGKQTPRNGDNMMGIKTYGKGGTDTFWHEYLTVQLDSTLRPGVRYYAEFYASRAVSSNLASNNLGMALSDTAITTRDRMPIFMTPVGNSDEIVKSNWNAWQKIYAVFEVDKAMNHLLIGNFYHDKITQTTAFPEGQGGAYYYIDDVKVRRALPEEALTPRPRISTPPPAKIVIRPAQTVSTKVLKLDSIAYRVGNTITLENIFFEFDKATLLPESKTELDKLSDILVDYPHMRIEISGHTDNVGSDAYNQNLSEERAKSVVAYLLEKDVETARLTYRGYGSSKPLVANETDQGRAVNRRVAFTVVSN